VVRERVGAGDSVHRISPAPADGGDHSASQTDAADGHDGEPKVNDELGGVIRMACTPVNSGQRAKRLAAATSDASPPLGASVLSIVADLEGHDLNGLRRHWRDHLGGERSHTPHAGC
jgi:hypothetical protein